MLPIDTLIPELRATLETWNTVLLQAPPGAGKTTRVPLALLDCVWRGDAKILMLEPRRIAARAAARFMARQLGEKPGETVGYRTRLDTRVSGQTCIEVVTEGILTRLVQQDPALEDYAAVLFDEFHERSLQADLGLALVRESQQALRDDLRVVVMSATLDTAPLARLLDDAPVLTSEGRAFPVDVHYRPLPPSPCRPSRLLEHVASVIREALESQTGSILTFLPGAGEIRQVERLIRPHLPAHTHLTPLYGHLKGDDQDRAIQPPPVGERKIVLATAIAETSLTIEGVRVVIDAGQERRAVFDANSGMTRLKTGRLSRAAAEQRKGRAGRMEPGVCYRLWSESEQQGLPAFTPPEILEADLAPLALELAQWGARTPGDLEWLDPPPKAHWDQAVELLQWLDLLDAEGAITDHGRRARELGIHPRLAHMVLLGRELGYPQTAARVAALLGERDLLGPRDGADVTYRLQLLTGEYRSPNIDRARLDALKRSVDRLMSGRADVDIDGSLPAGRLLALAYPDRIGLRRPGDGSRYQLSNGRGARLREEDALGREEWIVAAELDGQAREAHIYLAAATDRATLEHDLASHIQTFEEARWDDAKGTVVARRVKRLGALVLDQKQLPDPSQDQIQLGLLTAVKQKGIDSLPWTDTAYQWRARVQHMKSLEPDNWPDVSDDTLLANLDRWLAPFLIGVRNWKGLQQISLLAALQTELAYPQQQYLDRELPANLEIPTGQRVRLDYTAENGPVLATKLQTLFGWKQTPRLAGGRLPVVIHLLSPAQRPLAVTGDLASFWKQVYPEVRKEMRGRYPKHPWPDNPLTAEAKVGTKKSGR
ncbi:ATP-dependent helicase HrpB [Marinobacter nanhaiticus D15-8W]|uniref:ATP-dependent helicase HrpB n=1 Tax=Marinobacter nanhaiticus D15-8W TaxID=626887 RepID=N6WUN9_9GAMM|nr:ATP-dependent helicase HrpB [Marinobacter nanhaiticus]ENO15256.1 ATP-dependent helicase HrpB [Marinobacter nanhaiticus D15-8W]BES69041.1 ATP-dependent helicase HrpB [Marinobacter nanhaiticus D15-8W]